MILGFWIAGLVVGLIIGFVNFVIFKKSSVYITILLLILSFLISFCGSRAAYLIDKKDGEAATEIVYVSDVSKVVINEKEDLYDYILYFVWDNKSFSKKVDGSVIKSIYKDGSFQKCEIETSGWEVVSEDVGYQTTTVTEDK